MSQVETTPHEIEGRWKWPGWGRDPYDALSPVMLGPPFEGYLEITIEVDGEPWHLEVIDCFWIRHRRANSYRVTRTGESSG